MMAGVVVTLMAVSVTACGNDEEVEYDNAANRPPEPSDTSCGDWDWDDETGTYYCDDRRSSNFGMYYLMGKMFSSKSALKASSQYKTYQKSYRPLDEEGDSSSGGHYSGSSSSSSKGKSSYKSGIGSGSKGSFGG